MEFLLKYKIIVLRTVGALMLIVAFSMYFWTTPKEGLNANERAAANVARMESKAAGKNTSNSSVKKDGSKFLEELKSKQAKQIQYLVIFIMVLGVGFVGYSFVPKQKS